MMSSYTKEENALVEVDTACGRHSSRSSQSKRKGDPVILSGEEVVVCISSTVSDSDGEISVDDSALDQAGQIGSPGCLIPPSDSKSGERAALVSASPLRSHPINSKQKTDDQLSCAVIVGDTVEDSKGSESDCHVIASQSHVTVGDSHVTIGESHVTGTAEDRECRGSFESITASDSQDIVNVLSQEDRLVSSPKKKKRARDPPITSPHSFDTEGKAGMQALLEAVPPVSEHFHVSSKIGEGTFSSVYLAHLKENPDVQFALKHIVPTSAPCRIENELRCLQTFGGRQHVIGLETCLRHRDHVVFVLPYVKHDRFFDFIPFMTIDETRQYMKALFLALQQVHSHHIIHRDIKPSNFLYNIRDRQYHLLDFGLAHLESGRTGMFGDSSVLSGGSRRRSTSAPAPSNRLRQSPRLLTKALNNPSSAHTKALNNPSRAHTKALKNPSSVHTKALNNPSSAHTAIVTMTPTLPHALSTNNRANGMVQPSPHAVLVALNSGSEKQPSEQIARSLSRKSGNFTTPSNKRVNKLEKDETKSSDMKRGKRAVEDQKRQSVSAKRPLRRGDSKQVKSKSATKLKRKFEESCDFDHKETEVCELCMGRQGQNAPRAGTPGFRAPEVLLKCPSQTTAIDMWSAGVILLCILSGRYPFFRAQDDLTALSQIVGLLGTEVCARAAKHMGKDLVCRPEVPAIDLKILCKEFRSSLPNEQEDLRKDKLKCSKETVHSPNVTFEEEFSFSSLNPSSLINAPDSVFHLLYRLLSVNPADRITAEEALGHPFIIEI